MKIQNLSLIPVAFVAGIVSIVLLERAGLVRINPIGSDGRDSPVASAELSQNHQDSGSIGAEAESGTTHTPSKTPVNTNIDASLSGIRLSERIDELQQQLRSSTVKADMMQSKIKALEKQIEAAPIGTEFLPGGQGSDAVPGEAPVQQQNQAGDRGNRLSRFAGSDNDVQYSSLVSAGVDPLVAEQIMQRNDQWTLQRLELVDQATREGWRRSEQFSERLTALQDERPSIRDELGDSNYDRYLFASGESNRVQISSIINGSAAQIAGMENGDVVLSYANQRVFTSGELQQATREGSRGEPVQLEVLRIDELINIELPRGPMGVTLIGIRSEPSAF